MREKSPIQKFVGTVTNVIVVIALAWFLDERGLVPAARPAAVLGQNPPSLLSQGRYAVASGVKPTSSKHLEASSPLRNSRKSLAPSACGAFFIAAAG